MLHTHTDTDTHACTHQLHLLIPSEGSSSYAHLFHHHSEVPEMLGAGERGQEHRGARAPWALQEASWWFMLRGQGWLETQPAQGLQLYA